jgi:hypothetical protein
MNLEMPEKKALLKKHKKTFSARVKGEQPQVAEQYRPM